MAEKLYKKIYVNNNSLEEISKQYQISIEQFKNINPQYKNYNNSDKISGCVYVLTPVSRDTKLESFIYIPEIEQLKPRLETVVADIWNFNDSTKNILKQLSEKQKSENKIPLNEIFTHLNFVKTDMELDVCYADNRAWSTYKKQVFNEYKQCMDDLGYYFRDISYLCFVINENPKNWITKNDKVESALLFIDNLLFYILSWNKNILNLISFQYELLSGEPSDWVIYQNITDIVNAYLGKIKKYFSRKNNFSYYTITNNKYFYDYGYINTSTATEITDEFIFNYQNDYENDSKANKIDQIIKDIDKDFDKALKKIQKEYSKRQSDALLFCSAEYIKNNIQYIEESEKGLKKYLSENSRANKLYTSYKWPDIKGLKTYLSQLKFLALSSLNVCNNEISVVSKLTEKHSQNIAKANVKYYCYYFALVLFFIAAETRKNIGAIESLFVSEEELFDDVKNEINKLLQIAKSDDLEQAIKELNAIQKELEIYKQRAAEYIQKGQSAGFWIDLAVVVVVGIAATIVSPLAIGFVAGITGSTLVGEAAGIIASAVIITAGTQVFEVLDRGKTITLQDLAKSFGTNLLTMLAFSIVGPKVSALLKAGSVSNPVLLFTAKASSLFVTSLVISTPMFLVQLHQTGNHSLIKGRGKEWLNFIGIHAAFSGVFALSNSVFENFNQRLQKNAWSVGSNIRHQNIIKDWQKVYPQIKNCLNDYRSKLAELSEKYQLTEIKLNREGNEKLTAEYKKVLQYPKKLLKFWKDFEKELIILENTLEKDAGSYAPCEDGELLLLENSISDIETSISKVVFIEDTNYELACKVHDIIPNKGVDGLRTVGNDKTIYYGNTENIYATIAEIQKINFYEGNVTVTKSDAAKYFPESKTLAIEANYTVKGIPVTSRIQVIDYYGKSDIHTDLISPKKTDTLLIETKDSKKYSGIGEYISKELQCINNYKQYCKLTRIQVLESIMDGKPLSENERSIYIDLTNRGLISPKNMCRFIGADSRNPGHPYPLKFSPDSFWTDPFYFQGVKYITIIKTLLGYLKTDSIKTDIDGYIVFIDYIPSMFEEASYPNVEKALKKMYELVCDSKVISKVDSWTLENVIKPFRKKYNTYGFNKVPPNRTEFDIIKNISPCEDKYKKIMNIYGENSRIYRICELQRDYLSVFSLFSGKGYTVEYTGRIGIYEKLLKGPIVLETLPNYQQFEQKYYFEKK